MKKLISLVLILCMACMLVPAMAEDDITGDWYLTQMDMNGTKIDIAGTGMVMNFSFSADGTVKEYLEIMGEKQEMEGTWTLDGNTVTLTANGQSQTLTYADGVLTIESDGQTGILTREAPVAPEKPGVVAADSEEAFFGTWKLVAADMMGIYMTVDQIPGYDGTITIEAGKVVSEMAMGEGQEMQKSEAATTFADGKLTMKFEFPADQAEMMKAMGVPETGTIELLDNGNILYSMDYAGMRMDMYFGPADTAAEEPAA